MYRAETNLIVGKGQTIIAGEPFDPKEYNIDAAELQSLIERGFVTDSRADEPPKEGEVSVTVVDETTKTSQAEAAADEPAPEEAGDDKPKGGRNRRVGGK